MNQPSYKEFVGRLLKPTEHGMTVLHCCIGILGEITELMEAKTSGQAGTELEELGDVAFYYQGLCNTVGIEAQFPTQGYGCSDAIMQMTYAAIEAGQALDFCKKNVFYSKKLESEEILKHSRKALEHLVVATGIRWESAISANIEKLSKRYHEGVYSDAQAQARADKNE